MVYLGTGTLLSQREQLMVILVIVQVSRQTFQIRFNLEQSEPEHVSD